MASPAISLPRRRPRGAGGVYEKTATELTPMPKSDCLTRIGKRREKSLTTFAAATLGVHGSPATAELPMRLMVPSLVLAGLTPTHTPGPLRGH
jgi:hypothetical protein